MTVRVHIASRQLSCPVKPIAMAVGIALMSIAGAHAQTAQDQAPTADPQAAAPVVAQAGAPDQNKVVVTGYRYSIEKSLDQKRQANSIVEVVTAEDIGKFPDKNVADALQRVPGVIVTRDGGEGKNVSVRGLSSELTLTELNGNYIATAESNGSPTRSFNYTLMPSNMLGSAELFKTPEARIDEGGIGGTVILHTRRPLDVPSGSGFVNAEGTYADTTKKGDGQFSGQYAWHDKTNRFGVLVGLTSQKRTTRTMNAGTGDWQWYGDDKGANKGNAVDVNGNVNEQVPQWWGHSGFNDQNGKSYNNFMMPTTVSASVTEEERERKGGQLTLQFKPVRNLNLTANYFRFDLKQDSQTNSIVVPEWSLARFNGDGNWPGGRMLDGLKFDPSGTIVTGADYSVHPGKTYYCSEGQAAAAGQKPGGWGPDDCTLPTPWLNGSYNKEKSLSQTFDLGAEWRGESIDADFKAGRTWASGGPSLQMQMPIKPRMQNADGSWTLGNTATSWDISGTPNFNFSPELLQNLRNGIGEIDLGSTSSSWTHNSNKQNYAQADFTWHTDYKWLDSLQFGAKYRDGGVHRSTGNNYWTCQGTDGSYDNRFQNGCDPSANKFNPSYLYSGNLENLGGAFNTSAFPAINYPAYIDYLNKTYGDMKTRNEDNFVYNVKEKISSFYLQANYKTDRLRGNFGMRVVKTKQHADSTDQVENYSDYFFQGADGAPAPCTTSGGPAAGAPAGSGCISGFTTLPDSQTNPASGHKTSFLVNSLDRNYTDVLPSFNLAYDITDKLLFRAAASKAISRPSYGDIAAPGNLSYYSQEYVNDRRFIGGANQQGWFGNGSNKELAPYKAKMIDLGLEWYFQRGSVLGLGLFRKNVDNFTVDVVRDTKITIGCEAVTVQNYSTKASGRGAVSKGAEFYVQHTLASGLGFQFNYTINKTNLAAITLEDGTNVGQAPLVGSAKNQGNLTVFYETDKLLLRASYNRRGEVVDSIVNGFNVYEDPFAQIDLNAAYNITKQLALTASVLNLTKEESKAHLGNDTSARFYSSGYAGRVAYMGLNYKF